MKKSGLILIVFLLIAIIASGCEIKRSEDEIREEIKAELEAEIAAEAKAKEEAELEAAKAAELAAEKLVSSRVDQTIKIMTERLNVRRDPVLDSVKVGLVTNEKTYEILEEEIRNDGRAWYKIMYEPDAEGWIAGWYTLRESEVIEGLGRGFLVNAFEGKLDGINQAVGDNISGYIKENGEAISQDGFNGGDVYSYSTMDIFTYGDMGGDIEIGDIWMFSYTGAEEMYGVTIGISKNEIPSILGEPDEMKLNFTDDYTNLYTNNDLYYYHTGSYGVILVFSESSELVRIDIYED